MLVSLLLTPNVTLVRLLQSSNARSPMLVTLLGIVILVHPLQPRNAESAIVFVPILILYVPERVERAIIR